MPPASQDATTRAAAGRQRHGRGQWLVLGATVIVASLHADRRTRARLVAKASLVAPNTGVFIGLLIAGEATADILVLCGGRWMRAGLVLLIGFHVGLLFFGWWLYAVCRADAGRTGPAPAGRSDTTGSGLRRQWRVPPPGARS